MPSSPGKSGGFTLSEMLVVVAIIAVLAALLLPSLASAYRTAQTTRCLSRLKQIGTASLSFAADNNGCLPTNGAENPFDPAHGYGRFFYLLGPYISPANAGSAPALRTLPAFHCPVYDKLPAAQMQACTYMWSTLIGSSDGANGLNPTLPVPVHLSSVIRPSTTPMAWDATGTGSGNYFIPDTRAQALGFTGPTSTIGMALNHGRFCNVLFIGGNVSSLDMGDFNAFPWLGHSPPTSGRGTLFDPFFTGY